MSKMMIGMRDQKTRARKVRRETPAGNFKVIEIRQVFERQAYLGLSVESPTGAFTFDLVYFYSPRTKSVVKQATHLVSTRGDEAEYEMELIKYGHEAPAVGVPVVKAPATKMPVREIDWSSVKEPVYKDGDWWVFRVKGEGRPSEEYRVTYKNGKFESDAPEFLTRSDDKDSIVFGPLVSVHLNDPEKRWLDFPLVAGKKWSFEGFLWPEDTVFTDMWSSAEPEIIGSAPQPVETPAGKFKVIEIRQVFARQRFYSQMPSWPKIDLVYFYSPIGPILTERPLQVWKNSQRSTVALS